MDEPVDKMTPAKDSDCFLPRQSTATCFPHNIPSAIDSDYIQTTQAS